MSAALQVITSSLQTSADLRSQAYQPDELEEYQHPGNDELVHITSDTYSDRGFLRSLTAALVQLCALDV